MGVDVEFLEFEPDAPDEVLAAMADLAGGAGWLTFDPAIHDDFPAPAENLFGKLVSGRGPAVPRATWVPADVERRRPEPMSIGILHGTGADAIGRLAEKDITLPERWRVVADHSKRGLVAYVPIDIPLDQVLAWTLTASQALTRVPLTGRWRAAVHRR